MNNQRNQITSRQEVDYQSKDSENDEDDISSSSNVSNEQSQPKNEEGNIFHIKYRSSSRFKR